MQVTTDGRICGGAKGHVVNKICATAATNKYKTIKYLQLAQSGSIKYDGNIGIRFQRTTQTSTSARRDKEGERWRGRAESLNKCCSAKSLLEWKDNFIIRFVVAHHIKSSYFLHKHNSQVIYSYKYQCLIVNAAVIIVSSAALCLLSHVWECLLCPWLFSKSLECSVNHFSY